MIVNISNFTVEYPDGTVAVDGLSLSMGAGESVALVGANGAGKTSLMLAMVGILPSLGTAEFGGVLLAKDTVNEIRARVGVVFQNPDDQLFMPSIFEDVAFGPRNLGAAESEVKQRVDDCLATLGIEGLRDKTAIKLSGGEKRMAALATVLVMNPDVMLLDEPTAFLDPRARRKLIGVLNRLPQAKLIATHDLPFAAEVCPRSILLKQGRIFADGLSGDLLYDVKLMEDGGVEAIGVMGASGIGENSYGAKGN